MPPHIMRRREAPMEQEQEQEQPEPQQPQQQPKKPRWRLNWFMIGYVSFIHIAASIGIFYLPVLKWQTYIVLFFTFIWSTLGITAGAHRLWAHRSFKAHWTVRLFLMICSCFSNQGSVYHWARDHRVHHKFSETPADPHNANRGLFFAHVGWLLTKKDPKVIEAGKKLDLSDLERDSIIMFQKRWDPWLAMFVCFALAPLTSYFFWNEDFVAHYFVEVLRYVFILHCTWLVNSAAHKWGAHPYDDSINPAENPAVAFFAGGEGWHNWHHKFPYDYAASELGSNKHYNPTKMFIDACAYLGVVTDRKRALNAWDMLKKKRAGNDGA